jgi:gliding motility-associated-like protein
MRSLLVYLLLCSSLQAMATHIIGGNMYYDHLGGNQYRVTLVLYRDCGPDNVNNTGFDNAAQLGVFNAAGQLVSSTNVQFSGEIPVPVVLNDPCLSAPPTVCVRTALYQHVFTLPPIAGGYTVSYQRCCRTPAMENLSGQQGLTCTASIPGPPLSTNSSPRFDELPTVALCVGTPATVDFAAVDPDGDQLVYGLCAPFIGGSAGDPAPFPEAPPYATVNYAAGYSAGSPLDPDGGVSIDPNTGALTVSPSLQGVFTVGICVTELRDGVVVGETRGDFLFKVVVCDVAVVAAVAEQGQGQLCVGLTQTFLNESENGTSWSWDFGDEGTDADTSNIASPVWTYAQPGSYTVMLIANPGHPCADTSLQVYDMQAPMDIFFVRPAILCPGEETMMEVSGVFGPNALFTWELGDAGSSSGDTGPALEAFFGPVGVHPVTVSGVDGACSDSYTDSVVVYPPPVIGLVAEMAVCDGGALLFSSTSSAWTSIQHQWDMGDGTTLYGPDVEHIYPGPGSYSPTLTIRTDSGCVAELSMSTPSMVTVHALPTAGFRIDPQEVSLLDPEVEVQDLSLGAVSWSYEVEDVQYTEPSFTYAFQDGGRRTIVQSVISSEGCVDTTSRVVTVSDHLVHVPNAFTPNGDGVNDVWSPVVRGARTYELFVHDRWGREVFRTTDPGASWSGEDAGDGMYEYVIRLAEFGAFRKEYRGHFLMLR